MAYQFKYGFGLPKGEYRRIEIQDENLGRKLQNEYLDRLREYDMSNTQERKNAAARVRRVIAKAQKAA